MYPSQHAMQQVSGVCYNGKKQHKEVSNSRTNKDYEDAVMVMQYILPRSPFCPMKELINIHTGEVADRNVNVVDGYKIGLKIIEPMTGINTDKLIFKKKDWAVTKSESSIKINNDEIFVDPMIFFQQPMLLFHHMLDGGSLLHIVVWKKEWLLKRFEEILAIHAFLVCDTMSRMFSISKGASLTKF